MNITKIVMPLAVVFSVEPTAIIRVSYYCLVKIKGK
jgi:hypothetical protein